jgi:tetratricopeptide (TPR) repeat protein
VASVAKFEVLTGNKAKAHALAEGYFRSADPLAGDVPAKARRTAELHDELARMVPKQNEMFVGSAVAKYESLLPGHAEAIIKIASLLASTGRSDEAFAKLEKLQRGVSPRIVATAAVTALSAAPDAKYFARVKAWIDAAKGEDVRMIEAEYLGLLSNHAGAATLYDSVLKDQPRNVAALNNLAWLLSADASTADRALELLERASQEIGLTGELLDTRARIRLARGEPMLAIADAGEALKHDKTALRYFHLAIATQTVKPSETEAYFQEAIQRGLTERMVHPKDVETFRNLAKPVLK